MPPPGYEGAPLKVLARLSGDTTPTMLTAQAGHPDRGHDLRIVDLYWRSADLTDQQLVLGQPQWQTAPVDAVGAWRSEIVRIAYVKLVPLTDAEVDEAQAERRRSDTRRLFAHQDAHGPHYLWRLTDAEGIRREIEPYRHTDFARMYWEAGEGDISYYFSKIARWCTFDEAEDFARVGDRLHAESWRAFRDVGVDPFDVAIEHCHDAGLEIHASYRVAGFWYPPPIDHFNLGDTFAAAHPEWRGQDRDGQTTPRIAYSYPEVRAYVVSLLREMAERPIDGVCLLYNRRMPLVEYEPPVVAAFQREYGLDPHALPADDERWLRFRARELTQFMREVRQAMDEVGAASGRSARGVGRGDEQRAGEPSERHGPGGVGRGRHRRHADSLHLGARRRLARRVVGGPGGSGVFRGAGARDGLRASAGNDAAPPPARGRAPPGGGHLWRGRRAPVLLGRGGRLGAGELWRDVECAAAAGSPRRD